MAKNNSLIYSISRLGGCGQDICSSAGHKALLDLLRDLRATKSSSEISSWGAQVSLGTG